MTTMAEKRSTLVPLSFNGKELSNDEVILWGDIPLTAEQVSMAIKRYSYTKSRAAARTAEKRAKAREAKLLEQQKD